MTSLWIFHWMGSFDSISFLLGLVVWMFIGSCCNSGWLTVWRFVFAVSLFLSLMMGCIHDYMVVISCGFFFFLFSFFFFSSFLPPPFPSFLLFFFPPGFSNSW